MTNLFAAFDIFNVSIIGCAIVFGVCTLLAVLLLAVRCDVVYYDGEGKREIHRERHSWLSRVKIHGANKKGKRLVGWSKRPNGKKPLFKYRLVLVRSIKLYAIWADAPVYAPAVQPAQENKAAVREIDTSEGLIVKFNYIDTQSEKIVASECFRLNASVPEAGEGWGFAPDGKALFKSGDENYIFTINLYPVTALEDSDYVVSDEGFLGESVIDVAYTSSSTNEVIYKESHYFNLALPKDYEENSKFIGWSVVPDGDVVIERGEIDSVFTISLYSIEAAKEEIAEPVVEIEPIIEEPVEEIAEEPAVEEIVEEPVIEEAVEEPVVEEVVEEPVAEEVIEEPVAEAEPEFEVEVVEAESAEESVPAVLYEEVIEEYIPQPVVEEPVVEEIVEEPVAEVIPEPVAEVVPEPVAEEPAKEAEPILVPTYYDNEGNKIDIKYSRSFTANLIQSDDTVKDYYGELKNHILSYKAVKSRISWKFDSYNRGRDQLFKVKLRGKTICLYCALDPNEFDESKYHHEPIDAKIFEDVPMLVKIKSGLGLRKAKELVDITMAKFGIEKDEKAKTVDYVAKYPYEPNEPLLARKLIKALIADDAVVVMSAKPKEEPVVEPVIEVIPEPVVEEPVVEVIPEPAVEEEIVIEAPAIEPELVVESVSAEEVHQIIEEKHIEVVLEEGVDYITAKDNKKAIINVDTLSKNYKPGEDVTIQSMKDKKLIDKKAKSVKVLARGILDKPLKVRAGEFSVPAMEMIVLTGGHAMHVEYKIKK